MIKNYDEKVEVHPDKGGEDMEVNNTEGHTGKLHDGSQSLNPEVLNE